MDLIDDELTLLETLVPLQGARLLEAGCGAAQLARALLRRYTDAELVGLEVDERQLAKNLLAPAERLRFERAGAQDIPFADARFDGALMLKSLHHVPMPLMDRALAELARVLRPGGWLYVSEPVYAGPFNELVRLYNDEGEVRAAAQAALDRALASGAWQPLAERRFAMPRRFASFDEFEQRSMRPTFADHGITDEMVERVRALFLPHLGPDGARFEQPMHVRLLRKAG
jgi:ubiquinone/menaquinone biosynthesis C-methylase UbiE